MRLLPKSRGSRKAVWCLQAREDDRGHKGGESTKDKKGSRIAFLGLENVDGEGWDEGTM